MVTVTGMEVDQESLNPICFIGKIFKVELDTKIQNFFRQKFFRSTMSYRHQMSPKA